MAGLFPAIHVVELPPVQERTPRVRRLIRKSRVSFAAWMAGTSPAMTA
jgi:hypothetical protein